MDNMLDLDLKKNKKVIMSNQAITGKQQMDLREAKLLRLLIMQINMKDKKLMEYKADIKEVAECLGIDNSNLYRDVQKICNNLTTRRLGIKTDDPKQQWKYYPWMSMAEYDGAGTLTLGLNEKIRSFVLELNELFTQYEMLDILNINSFYALRVYELLKKEFTKCKKKKNVFELTIQELREITDTENKFKQIGHFRDKVINIAEREINEKTDISVKVEEIKKSRKYIGFRFIVTEKNKIKSIEAPDLESAAPREDLIPGQVDLGDVYKIIDLLAEKSIPCTMDQAQQLLAAYDGQINGCFLDNLDYVAKNNRIKNRVAYLLKISNDHVAHEPDRPDQDHGSQQRKKAKNKVATIEPMSEARRQAYLDLEVEYTEDLWPDLPVDEELEAEPELDLEEEYRSAVKQINEILKNPMISSLLGISSFDEDIAKIGETMKKIETIVEINKNISAEKQF